MLISKKEIKGIVIGIFVTVIAWLIVYWITESKKISSRLEASVSSLSFESPITQSSLLYKFISEIKYSSDENNVSTGLLVDMEELYDRLWILSYSRYTTIDIKNNGSKTSKDVKIQCSYSSMLYYEDNSKNFIYVTWDILNIWELWPNMEEIIYVFWSSDCSDLKIWDNEKKWVVKKTYTIHSWFLYGISNMWVFWVVMVVIFIAFILLILFRIVSLFVIEDEKESKKETKKLKK